MRENGRQALTVASRWHQEIAIEKGEARQPAIDPVVISSSAAVHWQSKSKSISTYAL
jgi:hypothetical protein